MGTSQPSWLSNLVQQLGHRLFLVRSIGYNRHQWPADLLHCRWVDFGQDCLRFVQYPNHEDDNNGQFLDNVWQRGAGGNYYL